MNNIIKLDNNDLEFKFTSYEEFIIFLQKNKIIGNWNIELK